MFLEIKPPDWKIGYQVGKQREWEIREARAMARQQRVDWEDGDAGDPQLNNGESDAEKHDRERMSQDNGIAEETNGRLGPSNGVGNGMDNGCAGAHLLVRSSENGNVIEGEELLEEDDVDGSFKGEGGEGEERRMSRLEVPRSLYSSNILGLSQETDSDAESIR